jgi:uncharacterized membrane protein YeaQ/YmgE (transglycosylase-associated protein family)
VLVVAGTKGPVRHCLLGNTATNTLAAAQLSATKGADMSIIAWIVVGAIAGILAGYFVTGDEGLGIVGRILLGIIGAVVGGFVAGLITGDDYTTGINIPTIIVATIGAIIVVVGYNMITGRSRTGRGAV